MGSRSVVSGSQGLRRSEEDICIATKSRKLDLDLPLQQRFLRLVLAAEPANPALLDPTGLVHWIRRRMITNGQPAVHCSLTIVV